MNKENLAKYIRSLEVKIEAAKEALNDERNTAYPDADYMQSLKDKIYGYENEMEECKALLNA